MGMFDTITISKEYQLPIDEEQQRHIDDHVGAGKRWKRRFQTKDLSCLLDYYQIDADGSLWKVVGGQGQRVPCDDTATVNFYDYITNDQIESGTDLHVEFQALIVQGDIKQIRMTRFKAEDNTCRVSAQQQWIKQAELAEKRRKMWSWRLYNVLYATPVNWCLKWLYHVSQHVASQSIGAWRRRLLFWD